MNENAITAAVDKAQLALVICDCEQDDHPIIYVNQGFEKLTGYDKEAVLGKNCRFMQGDKTSEQDVERLRRGIANGEEFSLRILNYKADGTTFINQLMLSPVHDDDGRLTAYIGLPREVDDETPDLGTGGGERPRHEADTDAMLREIQHRVKNHLAMIVSMIRIQADRPVTRASYLALSHRIEALAALYDLLVRPSKASGPETIDAGAYLTRVAGVIAGIEGRTSIRMNVDCDTMNLAVDPSGQLGLLLSELLTNAFNHAFEGRDQGYIQVRLECTESGLARLSVEDDGVGLPEGSTWPYASDTLDEQRDKADAAEGKLETTSACRSSGLGGSIVRGLTRALDARLSVEPKSPGLRVVVELHPDHV